MPLGGIDVLDLLSSWVRCQKNGRTLFISKIKDRDTTKKTQVYAWHIHPPAIPHGKTEVANVQLENWL